MAILEEPEHLTWCANINLNKYMFCVMETMQKRNASCRFHHGQRFTQKFGHVVGVMHTNYIDYIQRESIAAAAAIRLINRRLCNIHTHKVVKLSDAVQGLPRQSTCFCHGVGRAFLQAGDSVKGGLHLCSIAHLTEKAPHCFDRRRPCGGAALLKGGLLHRQRSLGQRVIAHKIS